MNTLKKEYEEAHPGSLSNWSRARLGVRGVAGDQMSGGTSPEIWYQRGYIAAYEKGWFVNSTRTCEPNRRGNTSWKRLSGALESGKAPDGHIYADTGDIVGTGFLHSKTLFEELGPGARDLEGL